MAIKKKSARQGSRKRIPSTPKKRTSSTQKVTRTRAKKKPQRTHTARNPKITAKTLDALNERLDMMLPEVMFRIAAIEHLLVKNQLCLYDELINARQFIQEQERS